MEKLHITVLIGIAGIAEPVSFPVTQHMGWMDLPTG
jgi:hypothetical protein